MDTISDTQLASSKTQSSGFTAGKVAVIAVGHAVSDTYSAFLPVLLPILIEKFALAKTGAGLLTLFGQIPSLLQPFIGYIADRRGLRIFVAATPAITAILMSFVGVAPSYILVAILLLVVGITSAMLHATGPVLTGRLSGDRLGMGMGYWMVGGEFGRAMGPIIIASAITHLGINNTPYISIFGIIISLLVYWQLSNVKEGQARTLENMDWKEAIRAMRPVLFPIAGIMFLRSFSFVAVGTFLPTFLTENGASLLLAGGSLTVMEVAGVVGAFFGGAISDRVGRRIVMGISMTLTPIFIFLLLMTSGWAQFPILLGLGLTSLALTPVVMAIVQESYPENRALANGIYMAINFTGISLAAVLIGVIADASNMSTAYIFSAITMLAGLPFVMKLPDKKRSI